MRLGAKDHFRCPDCSTLLHRKLFSSHPAECSNKTESKHSNNGGNYDTTADNLQPKEERVKYDHSFEINELTLSTWAIVQNNGAWEKILQYLINLTTRQSMETTFLVSLLTKRSYIPANIVPFSLLTRAQWKFIRKYYIMLMKKFTPLTENINYLQNFNITEMKALFAVYVEQHLLNGQV